MIPTIDRTYAGPGQTSGSPVSHYPELTNDGSSSATKNPLGTNRGSGSGGGIGIGSTGFGNLAGSFANSQASSYANSGSYSGSGGTCLEIARIILLFNYDILIEAKRYIKHSLH